MKQLYEVFEFYSVGLLNSFATSVGNYPKRAVFSHQDFCQWKVQVVLYNKIFWKSAKSFVNALLCFCQARRHYYKQIALACLEPLL